MEEKRLIKLVSENLRGRTCSVIWGLGKFVSSWCELESPGKRVGSFFQLKNCLYQIGGTCPLAPGLSPGLGFP